MGNNEMDDYIILLVRHVQSQDKIAHFSPIDHSIKKSTWTCMKGLEALQFVPEPISV